MDTLLHEPAAYSQCQVAQNLIVVGAELSVKGHAYVRQSLARLSLLLICSVLLGGQQRGIAPLSHAKYNKYQEMVKLLEAA